MRTNQLNKNSDGFTIIECIIVMSILSVLTAITVMIYIADTENVERTVCNYNCLQLQKMYATYLFTENIDHSDMVFNEFVQDYGQQICPCNCVITYIDCIVYCIVHTRDSS